MCYDILREIFTGVKSTRDKSCFALLAFDYFAEETFLYKTPVVDLITTVNSISLCKKWLHFVLDAAGSGCPV